MVEAITMAHAWEMERDASVVVLGQDVGANGGVFRATAGLQARFGGDRVQDTPLAEATIAGMSVGMAAHGLRPVAEIQFMGFMYPALDQIVNHMSRLRHRTRGRLSCPVVIRTPHGGGIHAPEHHSESTEALFCQIPGCPSKSPLPVPHLWFPRPTSLSLSSLSPVPRGLAALGCAVAPEEDPARARRVPPPWGKSGRGEALLAVSRPSRE